MDDETRQELDELRAELAEHDKALMALLRGRPRWAVALAAASDEEQLDLDLARIDTAADALDPLDEDERKLWERLLKLAPSTRALIARLLEIPSGDQRTAIAFCLTLDDERRAALDARVIAVEEEELARAGQP